MSRHRWLSTICFLCWCTYQCPTGLAQASDDPGTEANTFFETRIRPVLADRCIECHGPRKQEMGLRLDTADAVTRGGDAGPVIVPGKPDESPLLEALWHTGAVKMPPRDRLEETVIHDFETWIKQGAGWPAASSSSAPEPGSDAAAAHWAFLPVQKPAVPAVTPPHLQPAGPIDLFLGQKRAAAGLEPSPPADRRTLLRRLSFDLVGLPPTADEVADFVSDPRPDDLAWAKQVDRLLASPRHGERWGRYWLDVARYADTKGYVFLEDGEYHWAWTYRDYVIEALNADRPYDQFLTDQLAADLRQPAADPRDLRALGFLTVGGRFLNNAHDIIDDRIDVVTRGLMGLTVSCARCHDHKFDPVSQADYYSLYGVFASSKEPSELPLYEPTPDTDTYRAFAAELEKREGQLSRFIQEKRSELEASAQRRVAEYLLQAAGLKSKPSTEDFMQIADSGDLNPAIVGRWQGFLERARKTHHPVLAAWLAFEDLADESFSAELGPRLDRLTDGSAAAPINPVVLAALRANPPRTRADVAARLATALNQTEAIWRDYERRCTLEGRMAAALPDPAREELRLVFHAADAPSNIGLLAYGNLDLLPDRASQDQLRKLQGEVETWNKTGPGAPPRAMVLNDAKRPVDPHIFIRGNPNRQGAAVPRTPPHIVLGSNGTPVNPAGSGRLELAQAVTDRANPLTARVLVNRVWLHHFGSPIVASPGDLGLRGEPPTHPQLLDWLAATFQDDGSSLKALHRRIVSSGAYRQASLPRPEAEAVDPENHLVWRMNRQRLDLEALRDALLAASGRLDGRIGGPSFASLVDLSTPRRSVYARIDRLNLPGLFRAFDFPDPAATSPKRGQTTVPPQALFLMNHPFAAALSTSALESASVPGPNLPLRLNALFLRLFQRPAQPAEIDMAEQFLRDEPEAGADPELAWKRLAHALMMTNEFTFVD